MKQIYKYFRLSKRNVPKELLFLIYLLTVSPAGLFSQTSYSFTPSGATGSLGPTQTQVTNSYSATTLNGMVTAGNGIQSWTVPTSGLYRITATGGQGGGADGGRGAIIGGDFNLNANTVLRIVVGQVGITQASEPNACGGGRRIFCYDRPQ